MVDLDELEETFVLTDKFFKAVRIPGAIVAILNFAGFYYDKVYITLMLTPIVLLFYWTWANDRRLDKVVKILKDKKILTDLKGTKMNKRGSATGKAILSLLGTIILLYFFFTYILPALQRLP